ncbi:MAG: GGDEF domain-containing protein [Chitinophagaceae bacterium]|nr:GGDEF domain-containing protein [Rubrivivax sp.]
MKFPSSLRAVMNVDNDALADHRNAIIMHLSAIGSVVMLSYALWHLTYSRWPLVGLNAVVAGLLLNNAYALRRARRPLLPFWVLASAMTVAVCASTYLQGVPGMLWAFPMLFMCYFGLPRRLATLLGGALMVASSGVAGMSVGPDLGMRLFVSLCFVMVMINVVLNVIGGLQQALVAQTITDPLTGAYNRRHFQAQLDRWVDRDGVGSVVAEPQGPEAGDNALFAIDIDHFKRINDRHGHDVGDEVLRKVVAVVAARKRAGDQLFRVGGEEFLLLLPGLPEQAALNVAEELRQRLARTELLPGEEVTVSIGVSMLGAGQSVQQWVKRADIALYDAKRSGRNRVSLAPVQQA